MRLLLLLGPVRHDRRPGHAEADHADMRGRLRARHLLEEDRLEAVRGAGAAVLLRPGQPGVAGLEELAAPLAAEVVVEALLAASPAAPLLRQVVVQPRAQLGAKGCFLGCIAQIHAWEPIPAGADPAISTTLRGSETPSGI